MKKSKKYRDHYAMGTGMAGLASVAPEILDGIMSLLEGQKDYSSQPIVNAQTIKNMATPYSNKFGFGGIGKDGKPRKVDAAPEGYEPYIMPNGLADATYYRKATQRKVTTTPGSTGTRTMPRKRITTATKVSRPSTTSFNDEDIVYTMPTKGITTKTIVDKPVKAFEGEPIYAGGKLAFSAKYPARNSIGQADSGILNTSKQNVTVHPMKPNSQEVNTDETYEIPPEILNSAYFTAGGNTLQNAGASDSLRTYRKPKMALGGTIDDLTPEEYSALEQAAIEQGITVEEMLDQMNSNTPNEEETDDTTDDQSTLADSFSDEEETPVEDAVPGDEEEDNMFQGSTYGRGGTVPIEVEGGEVMQTPNGRMGKVRGQSHEEGGVDMNVKPGTKIYSDRIAIDGKTMQQRKLRRERTLAKMHKALGINPMDTLAKNSMARTTMTSGMEEKQDMALQEAANKIYDAPHKRSMGGPIKEKKYAFGGEENDDWINDLMGFPRTAKYVAPANELGPMGAGLNTISSNAVRTPAPTIKSFNSVPLGLKQAASPPPKAEGDSSNGFTTGDYVGMAGSIFGAVAPLINTRNAARATKPNINRYKGIGQEALQANDFAQTYVAADKANTLSDLQTSANTQYARNRNSARGVNTVRALDAVTTMGKDKARATAGAASSNKMMSLLAQRGQLANTRDIYVAKGATDRDLADKADTDNYYSNLAKNLANISTTAQGLGRNLNRSEMNKDQMDIMGTLTRNGIRFKKNKNGKYVLANT